MSSTSQHIVAETQGILVLLRMDNEVSCNRYVPQILLAYHSSMLRNMWKNQFADKNYDEVLVYSGSPATLDLFVAWLMSTEIVAQSTHEVAELYVLADYFDVPQLRQRIVSWFFNNFTAETKRDSMTSGEIEILLRLLPTSSRLYYLLYDILTDNLHHNAAITRSGKRPRPLEFSISNYEETPALNRRLTLDQLVDPTQDANLDWAEPTQQPHCRGAEPKRRWAEVPNTPPLTSKIYWKVDSQSQKIIGIWHFYGTKWRNETLSSKTYDNYLYQRYQIAERLWKSRLANMQQLNPLSELPFATVKSYVTKEGMAACYAASDNLRDPAKPLISPGTVCNSRVEELYTPTRPGILAWSTFEEKKDQLDNVHQYEINVKEYSTMEVFLYSSQSFVLEIRPSCLNRPYTYLTEISITPLPRERPCIGILVNSIDENKEMADETYPPSEWKLSRADNDWVIQQELDWRSWVEEQAAPLPDNEKRYRLCIDWAFAQFLYFGKVRWWPHGTTQDAKEAIDPRNAAMKSQNPWDLVTRDSLSLTTAITIGFTDSCVVVKKSEHEVYALADFGGGRFTKWHLAGNTFRLDGWQTMWHFESTLANASDMIIGMTQVLLTQVTTCNNITDTLGYACAYLHDTDRVVNGLSKKFIGKDEIKQTELKTTISNDITLAELKTRMQGLGEAIASLVKKILDHAGRGDTRSLFLSFLGNYQELEVIVHFIAARPDLFRLQAE